MVSRGFVCFPIGQFGSISSPKMASRPSGNSRACPHGCQVVQLLFHAFDNVMGQDEIIELMGRNRTITAWRSVSPSVAEAACGLRKSCRMVEFNSRDGLRRLSRSNPISDGLRRPSCRRLCGRKSVFIYVHQHLLDDVISANAFGLTFKIQNHAMTQHW